MNTWWRKFVLTLHILSSVGWMGAVAVFVVLDVAALVNADSESGRLLWLALEATTWSLIIPLAIVSLTTGIVSSVGTGLGLFRHYWVLFKLVLTLLATVVLVLFTQTIDAVAETASDPSMAGSTLPTALLHTGGGLVVLVLAAILGIYKPRGMTRYGQRRRMDLVRRPGGGSAVGPGS